MTKRTLAAFLVACAVGFVWLNQGTSLPQTETLAADIAAGRAGWVDRARYPFAFLYRQAWDEEIYFAVARAIRGLPYDRARLVERGATSLAHAPAADGHWHRPYADVPTEYPPALLPFMLAPSFVASTFEGFAHVFGALMAACLLGAAALAMRATPEALAGGRSDRERWFAMAALLLAQGGLAIQRLDAVPALLLAWTLWAIAERRPRTTGIALGLATAAKLVPVLLVGPMVVADRDAWGAAKEQRRGAIAFATTLAVAMAPLVFPLQGLLEVLRYHGARGLHVESTYGTLLGAVELANGSATPTTQTFGSYNFGGPVADRLAILATPMALAAITALTVSLARTSVRDGEAARRERLALAMTLAIAVLWLTSKVFSPQYLTWAIPVVLAVPGRRGRALTWTLVATMGVTQIYLRGYYDAVTDLRPIGVATLLVRLGLLVLFVVLAVRGLRAGAPGNPREAAR